ncbi:MetQ/NlpA family ABC transporter substrate-binding protein [Aquamicrobium terrae]|uniref:Lipoprotein n=1 Tax=Aquamicrobium terrae TaxID=1324945 RepID=A0ABV2N5S6_9HYPH
MTILRNTPRAVAFAGTSRRTALLALAASVLTVAALTLIPSAHAEDKTSVKVGIMAGEEEDTWAAVKEQAAKNGLTVETVIFNDYTQPNEALARGDIDANAFQHEPYLENQIATQGYKIVVAGYTALWPVGLYSKKHKSLADLPDGAVIGVPNDPSNEGRALKVLEDAGLIKLREGAGILATVTDVAENPKNLEIKELDAGIVGRSVDDLDGAVVNTDWALKSGLTADIQIAKETIENNPYRNFIAVREEDKDAPWVKKLVSSYQNDAVKAAFDQIYKGAGVSAY